MGSEKERVRFYLDEDISPRVAQALRAKGVEAISAYEVGNIALDDEEHLEYAANEGYTLVTCNARHFVPLFKKWWREGRAHSGIVVSKQMEFGEMVKRLIRLAETVTREEMHNNIKHLGEFK